MRITVTDNAEHFGHRIDKGTRMDIEDDILHLLEKFLPVRDIIGKDITISFFVNHNTFKIVDGNECKIIVRR